MDHCIVPKSIIVLNLWPKTFKQKNLWMQKSCFIYDKTFSLHWHHKFLVENESHEQYFSTRILCTIGTFQSKLRKTSIKDIDYFGSRNKKWQLQLLLREEMFQLSVLPTGYDTSIISRQIQYKTITLFNHRILITKKWSSKEPCALILINKLPGTYK